MKPHKALPPVGPPTNPKGIVKQMTLDFYAYWNGAQVRDLFEAVAAITSSGDFTGLLRLCALFGLLVTLTIGALRFRGQESVSFFMATVLFYGVTIVPKAELAITDTRAGTVHTVDGVPLGLAFLASGTSHIGHWLTEAFETVFANTEAERFSSFGMVFPERAVTALLAAGPVTEDGRQLIGAFNRFCVTPELINDTGKLEELTKSANLWKTVCAAGWVNPARQTELPDGSWVSCEKAVTIIETHLNTVEIAAIEKQLGLQLVPDRVDPSATIVRVLPQAQNLLLGLSQSLSASLKHSVFINTLGEDIASTAALANAPLASATKIAKAQASLASELNYRTMAQIAQEALPKIRNALEFIILAAFPLIAVMMIALGHAAGLLLRHYLTLLIWVQLWAPVCAVINYLIVHVDAHPMNRIVAEFGANSLIAAEMIREMGASSQAIAGFLTILAPVIAFAIAKGSDIASAQMVASVMAPAQGAAQAQGSTLSSGTVSMGNVTWGNVSTNTREANRANTSIRFTEGGFVQSASAYGSVTRTASGTVTGLSATPVSLGITPSMGLSQNANQSTRSSLEAGMSYSMGTNFAQTETVQATDKDRAGFARLLSQELSRGSSMTDNASERLMGSRQQSTSESVTLSNQFSNTERASYSTDLDIGLTAREPRRERAALQNEEKPVLPATGTANLAATSAPSTQKTEPMSSNRSSNGNPFDWIKRALKEGTDQQFIDGALGLQFAESQQQMDATARVQSAGSQLQRQEAYERLKAATRQIGENTREAGIKTAAKEFEANLSRAMRLDTHDRFNQDTSHHATRDTGFVSQRDIRTMMDNNPMAIAMAIDTFGSAEAAQEALFHSRAARTHFAAQVQREAQKAPYLPTMAAPFSPEALDQKATLSHQAIRDDAQESFSQKAETFRQEGALLHEKVQLPNPQSAPETAFIREEANRRIDDHTQGASRVFSETLAAKGATQAADALYRYRQKGVGTLLDNAFLGGVTYQSPENYRQNVQSMSETVPGTHQALAEIGEKSAPVNVGTVEKALQTRIKDAMEKKDESHQ